MLGYIYAYPPNKMGAFQVPMRRVHETHNRANADLAAVLQDRERVKKQCEGDLMRLTLRVEQARTEDLAQTTSFNEEKEKSNEFLKVLFCFVLPSFLRIKRKKERKKPTKKIFRRIWQSYMRLCWEWWMERGHWREGVIEKKQHLGMS